MLGNGVQLMVLGVGSVFIFLGLLVLALYLLSSAVRLWERLRPSSGDHPSSERRESEELEKVAAAIAVAVNAQERE